MNCNHRSHETCLHGDECAECLRQQAKRWRECAEMLRPFASAYSTHPKRNLADKLADVLAMFDALVTSPLTK